uniref:Envelope glycoprotein n=2 Tax=Reston ebolavirus TaxID=186539 RepID=VGP_EBORR|nr:RecName: Full=Envelope glycoprotein; AltName: Full=GP1,2; Short=GP; Contains: RecName: Full=GP1; Contains: RecName: Full=GP2; Contains: RecName: Full=Shed GP; AltName: Full=GP1,2-delta; Flags: Precursor [Reston ebolavirus - Reston (1989)]AAC24346.1 virion spike glycoprotein precursor [Reston ebolavirus]AAC54885.1 virion spike glycoprotein [Reston ebolavirus]AAV48577.1 structural surface glycoprotein [Reston ebolavirus]ARU80300.1 GP [Reston ebolavirus]ARU80308.1 GP [Reston ebolavirus]
MGSGYQLLQLPRERFRKTSFLVWVIILFQRAISMPLGIVTNSTLKATEIDQLVCRDKLSSTSQLKSVGLNLEGNGIATDVPSATKRWGFRSGVPPKVVSYEAGEWAENCYNLEIKKSDGSECLPLPPDGVRGFPRCRYVHKVQGTGPCPGDLAFHKNGAFFLYDRLASTVIYRGTTFAEGVVAFLILSEPKKHFWKATPAHEPVNTTDDSTSYYMTLTLSYEMSNFGGNESNTLFKVDNHTYVQLDRPHTPQFLVQLNETLRRNNRLSNSTGRLTWTLDPKIEPDVGEWAFWETKKNFSQQLHGENLHFQILSTHTNNSSDQSPAGTVQGKISYHPPANNSELVPTDSPPVVSVLTAGRTEEMSTQGLTNGETITGFTANPMTTTIAPSPTMTSEVDNNVPSEQPNNTASIEDSPPSASNETIYHSEMDPIQGSNNSAQSPQTKTTPAPTTSPMTQDPQETANSSKPGTSPGSAAGPSQPGLTINTVSKVADSLSPTRKQKRSVRQNTANKCNPDLYYWTAVDEGAAVGLAWIPYFGPAAEGIYIEGVMHNQNGLICGLRQLANETTQALQLFLRATTELRTYSLLNRKAIDFLLQRWGGTCRILGPSCCIEPHDWTKNITDEINQIKHDFIDNPLPDHGDDLNLWTGWRQWIPAGIGIIGVIIAIIALLCICKILC